MRVVLRLLPVACALLTAAPALAFEEPVRREEVDGGVHIPVLTKAPGLITFIQADYPKEAQDQGLTASVRLIITIAADGSVSDAQVAEPVGNGFDEAAVAAVRQFVFTPAEVDNVPAPVQIEYLYNFVLSVPDAGVPDEEVDAGPPPAAPATLTGVLLARGSRSVVSGAIVRCANYEEPEAVSTEQGTFTLNVPSGLCKVRVIASDYDLFETDETLEPGETREVKYYVLPKTVGYQTVVRGKRDKKEVVRRTISRQELQKIPGSFGDPVRVIQNFPGVARAPFILGQLVVRGAQPDQTLTYFDGVEIPILFHLGGGPSVVNGEFLDRVDFFPGGFGARYGRAVGGVVDAASRKGAADTLHGVVKVDLQDSSVFLETPITDGVSLAASFRRSYIDALLPLVLPEDPLGGSLLVLPVYWDYQVRLDVGGKRGEKAEEGKSTFSLFAFGSDDLMKIVATGGGRNVDLEIDFHTNFHRLLGTWTYRQGNTTLRLLPWVGYDLGGVDLGVIKFRVDQYSSGLRQDLEVGINKNVTLRFGTDIYYEALVGEAELPVIEGTQFVSFPGAEPKTGSQRFLEHVTTFDGALFAEADFTFGNLVATPGVRASHAWINGQTRHAFDPRLWVRYQLLDSTALKGSVGLYTQPPNGTDMEPPPFGTPSLDYEKAFQTSLGVSHAITDVINVDVTGFYNRRFENVSSPGPTTVNANGSITRQRFANEGLGRAYGLEVMLRHEVTRNFFGWIAYTLSRAEERTAGSDRDYVITANDQTHILTAVGSYRLPYGFEVGARFRYVTGNPKTPLIHEYDIYRSDANGYTGTRGAPRSARNTDFHQLDVRIDKYFVFDRWTLDLFLDVQNVYNQQNVEATLTDYRQRNETDVPGIPILPILGAKGSF